jgi:hypothetical protein
VGRIAQLGRSLLTITTQADSGELAEARPVALVARRTCGGQMVDR